MSGFSRAGTVSPVVAVVAALTIAGPSALAQETMYRCGDRLARLATADGEAVLTWGYPDWYLRFPVRQVEAASGARYVDVHSSLTFWSRGEEATLTQVDGTIVRCRKVAASTETVAPAALVGSWRVIRLGREAVPPATSITVEFASDGRVAGRGGCNRYAGPYSLTSEGLTFGELVSTRMACPPPQMEIETRFFGLMRSVTRASRDFSGELRLMAGDAPALALERAP